LRVRNRLTTKTIASPDITDDATDWRQIAARLMVAKLIPTMQPTGRRSPQDQRLLIDSDDATDWRQIAARPTTVN
jgi:hypothetical protein